MFNFFKFAPYDASLEYLIQIFGRMGGVIYDRLGGIDVGRTLIGEMFTVFNSVVLTIGILLVIYTTVVGVMQTAHEGEFMGKKWNNPWVPIRTVLGVAALIPTTSGYSFIQLVLMWIIVQGIGAADVLWSTTLVYIDQKGLNTSAIRFPGRTAQRSIQSVFQSLVCNATASIPASDPTGTGQGKYCGCGAPIPTFDGYKPTAFFGPGGECGSVHYCIPCTDKNLKCATCEAEITALQIIVPELNRIAQKFAEYDYNYRDFYYNSYNEWKPEWNWIADNYCKANNIPKDQCCVASPILKSNEQLCQATRNQFFDPNESQNPTNASNEAVKQLYLPMLQKADPNFLDTALNEYASQIQLAIDDFSRKNPEDLRGPLGDAQKTGWIFAGAYYFYIAKTNRINMSNSVPSFSTSPAEIRAGSQLNDKRNNYNAAYVLVNEQAGASAPGNELSKHPSFSGFTGLLTSAMYSLHQSFKDNITSTRPLADLQNLGNTILSTVEGIFAGLLTTTLIVGTLAFLNAWVLGSGGFSPVGGGLTLSYFLFMPAVLGLLVMLLSVGGLLGVYVPMIPYMIFALGAIGWMIAIIECMVAGPLVALAIMSPSGQHELLGKADHALMLVFSIFLRPSLMVFGMMAAMVLSSVVVTFINATFSIVTNSIASFSMLGFLFTIFAYVMLIISALNKCFQMIYLIPDQVLRWIGSQGEHSSVGESMQQIKGGFDTGAGKVGGAMGSARGHAETALDKGNKAAQAKKDADKGRGLNVSGGKGKGGGGGTP